MHWESGELDWNWLLGHASVCGLVLGGVRLVPDFAGAGDPGARLAVSDRVGGLLGVIMVPVVGPSIVTPVGWQSLATAWVLELLAGAVLGYLAATIIAGARMAGELVAAGRAFDIDTADPRRARRSGRWGGFMVGLRRSRFWGWRSC